MKLLVISQAKNGQINDNLASVLTAATAIFATCDVLLIGNANIANITKLACVDKVMHVADIYSTNDLATNLAKPIAEICEKYTHVLTAADSYGKDILPRIAGILGVSQISEVIEVVSPNIFKKPMYAGNVVAEIESLEDLKLLTVRPTSFAKYTLTDNDAEIEIIKDFVPIDSKINFINEEIIYGDTIDLAHAQIIVTGGRSLGSKAAFDELIHGLALKMGGAVGASRAAVEASYAANDLQIGQTGKVVAPKLYLAIGISGAVQHIAGMKDSKIVIAVNLDPNAQIFEYADYGLVGDLFEIVPEIIKSL